MQSLHDLGSASDAVMPFSGHALATHDPSADWEEKAAQNRSRGVAWSVNHLLL